nr:HAMP domain-containing sensor histidine kinase [Jongsikchunia kroppenstedtii]
MMIVLVAVGLTVSGVAVTSAMRGNLVNRVDDGLRDAVRTWARPVPHLDQPPGEPTGQPGSPGTHGPGLRRPPSQYYVKVIAPDGALITDFNDYSRSEPKVPDPDALGPGPHTVGSVSGSTKWRVISKHNEQGTVIVAASLTDVNATVDRLVWLQFGIGAAIVAIIGALGYILVRTNLRPLRQVEATAEAIAAGDLNRRVPELPTNTEVGRLSASLNVMLHQIEEAFSATAASEEQARKSEDKMRRFVADASHELRTPLTSIRGFAELYRQGAMSDPNQTLGRIESQAKRMGVLVEELLMLARLDAQRPMEHAPVDLLALASDSVHAAKAIAPDRDISLEVADGPGVPEVIGDADRLTQVLSNLISNAIRHTPPDAKVVVRIGTNEQGAFMEVHDDGPGLSADDQTKVFERFYRTDESRQRHDDSGGSGLGLAIVSALVQAHGGEVGVDSEPGQGCTFWVRLPRVEVP